MTTLGKYELHEVIGEGSLGTVYRATDESLGRVVAIKVLNPARMAEGVEAVERFRREVSLNAQLKHYNIVPILEVGQENGQVFIVMPCLQSKNLAQQLQDGPIPYDRALYILRDVCAGLRFAHAQGRVHGDLKPANILFNAGPCAVLADFGLALAMSASSGGALSSAFYRAPELWHGMSPSPAADVYALGCILGEMLTGKSLFGGDTPEEVRTRHLSTGPDWGADGPPAGDAAGCAAVVERALQCDPASRYASAADFWAALLQPAPRGADAAANAPADLAAGDSLAVTLPGGVMMQFVRVPAGEWMMGVSYFKRAVYLDEYWMGKYPVTNAQYAAFVNAVGWRTPRDWKDGVIPAGKENHPVVNVDWQDAAALDYAHTRQAWHRDVKPGNILMDAAGHAHLGDFGLVAQPDAPHLTQIGGVVGSPAYMAPEQAEGRPLDGRADQYSLAVIAYELLVGKAPFQAESSTSIALMHLTQPPPVPSQVNPDVPAEVDAVLLRGLAKKPEERYPSCAELVRALEAALQESNARRFRQLLAEAREHIQAGQPEKADALLMDLARLAPSAPQGPAALQALEADLGHARQYAALAQTWEAARHQAASALEHAPDLPDPQGIFPLLGLRAAPRPPMLHTLKSVGLGLLIAALPAFLILVLFWLWIDHA